MGASKGEEPPIPRLWEEDPEPSTTSHTGAPGAKNGRSIKRPALLVMAGSSAGRIFPIQCEKVTVGRSKQAGFTLDDEGISRMHCGIAFSDGAYVISDLGSTNGTLLNGGRTDRAPLRPGDRIQIGPTTVLQFDFYDEAAGGLVQKIYEAATRDLLTGALNRRAFDERLMAEVAYAVRHRAKLVAVAIEIDELAAVTTKHGNAASDAVLSEAAAAISSTLRGEDLFARVSGEKFIVLARGLSMRRGAKLAERVRRLVEGHAFERDGESFHVRMSHGVAELAETGRTGAGANLVALANERLKPAA